MAIIAFDPDTKRPLCAILQVFYGGSPHGMELALMADCWQLTPPNKIRPLCFEVNMEQAREIAAFHAKRKRRR